MKDARQLYQEFMERIGEVIDLRHASALLQWDQEVHMPEKGAEARGCQLATLAALEHRMFTSDGLRGMVEELSGMDGLDAEQSVTVAETKRDLDRALRIPEKLVHAMAEAQSRAYQAWVEARKKSDFPLFLPHLETLVALAREKAECLGYAESPYDALLDEYERGMTASQLRPLFDNLAERQSALLARIMESGRQPDVSKMDRDWDAWRPWATISRRAGRTSPSTPSPPPLMCAMCASPPGWIRATFFPPCPVRSTRAATPSMSRGFRWHGDAPPWRTRPPWACTSPSRGSGRMWWDAACPSGGIGCRR